MTRILIASIPAWAVLGAAFFLLTSPVLAATCGTISFYSEAHHGRPMANGRPFNMHALTTASPSLPMGTVLIVRNVQNGQSVQVTVTDRGPAKRLNRILDLSKAAFAKLAPTSKGVIRACFERV